jgi:radical SAM protein with 4Fe4S-binding SPASM domain
MDPSNDHHVIPRGGVMTADIDVYEYPVNKAGSPHARRRRPAIVLIQDISVAAKGNHSVLNNHAGAAAPLDDSQAHSLCAKPFREMSVRHDGSVAICCNDWRGHFKAGNVVTEGLDGVWNNAAMDGARRRLMQRQRDFGPCRGCNATSYRVGLLPDKMGKATMPRPTPQSNAAIAAALRGAPYTAPVARPWETE